MAETDTDPMSDTSSDHETAPYNSSSPSTPALFPAGSEEPDWDKAPDLMTARQASELLTVAAGSVISPANVRTRISRKEFPGAGLDASGQNKIPKADVQAVYQRFRRERTAHNEIVRRFAPGELSPVQTPQTGELTAPVKALMERLDAQHSAQIALVQEGAQREREAAQEAVQRSLADVEHLRQLLLSREATTRETLTHMDALYAERLREQGRGREEAEARLTEQIAEQRAEFEREKARLEAEIEEAKKPRKLFGLFS